MFRCILPARPGAAVGTRLRLCALIVLGLSVALSGVASAKTASHSRRAPRSYARAYGYVIGRAIPEASVATVQCTPGKGKRQVCKPAPEPSRYYDATEEPPTPGSPEGVYCFRAASGISPGVNAVVIVGLIGELMTTPALPTGSKYLGLKGIPDAMWIPAGTNCTKGEFEIQTVELSEDTTGLVSMPSGYVSFSFVIP